MHMHQHYIQRCLDLAIQGLGNVAPNPLVGSVIVHDDKIIGEGYHQQFGKAHAEVNAIQSVNNRDLLKESTLYVNLEPCSHFGKTPPCADLILQNKIPRVVIGSYDPNPKVAGKGIQKLREAGVEVVTEILITESDFLNRRFIAAHTKHRPYIILKFAQSADGFMALTEPKQFWFTNEVSKKLMHKWRTEEEGILVGRNTVAVDDCELTARLWPGKNPVRIVIDRKLSLPADRKIFSATAKTFVFNEVENKTDASTDFIQIDFSKNVLEKVMKHLQANEIQSIIIEGGPDTLQHFISQNLWDEARIFTTPHQLKAGKPSPTISGFVIEEAEIETDKLKIIINSTI
ncbi:MAG: bifunctional diaminohydroxyphosphoribosylaminopyrimidine deaminase/5-amino-6-(5-phosphoribosylamino)uracil reductase RibD [Bacteroidetes bacterium]|nr:bifunctional diaminohydroxyphosphoribosylaminopyrimidine deaminase/5-amino-6-(5-phosphoribosylamino)uracil reductase RibD [Bacteroidota bacterium]